MRKQEQREVFQVADSSLPEEPPRQMHAILAHAGFETQVLFETDIMFPLAVGDKY